MVPRLRESPSRPEEDRTRESRNLGTILLPIPVFDYLFDRGFEKNIFQSNIHLRHGTVAVGSSFSGCQEKAVVSETERAAIFLEVGA